MKLLGCIVLGTMLAMSGIYAQDRSSDGTGATEPSTTEETTTVDESTLIIETDPADNGAGTDRLGVFSAWDYIRMILVLAAVIGTIYLVFFLLKRSGNPKIQENRLIKVLSTKPIAGGKSIHLVEVGNQVFLVGSGENGVSLLSEIVDKETLDGIRLQAASVSEGEKRSFGDVLSSMFGKPDGDGEQPRREAHQEIDTVGFLQEQRRRLKQM